MLFNFRNIADPSDMIPNSVLLAVTTAHLFYGYTFAFFNGHQHYTPRQSDGSEKKAGQPSKCSSVR